MSRILRNSTALAIVAGALSATPAAAEKSVTIGLFGGNWGDAFTACIVEPFTAATGITVVPEIGTSTVNLSKVQQQAGAQVIDAFWMDGGVSEVGMAAGVLDHLDPASIPNIANLVPQALYSHEGENLAVSTGYYAFGIAYNSDEVKTPPTSWADLWSADFANAVTFPAPANALGIPTVFFLSHVMNGGDFDATFKQLGELKAALFYDSSGAAANAFQTGEAVIGAFNSAPAWGLNDQGLPLQFVVPKEGAWGGDVRLHLVKGAPNKEAAEQFINFALTPEASACLAAKLYLGPSVKGAEVPAEVAAKLPWAEGGSVDDLTMLDWWEINKQRAELVDRWNREVGN